MKSKLRGVDPTTFEVLLGYYARDAKSVFFGSVPCRKIDRATFRAINGSFGVDAKTPFFCIAPIKQADPQSFRPLDSGLVHTGSKHTSGEFLGAGYAADDKAVWFCSGGGGVLRLKAADPTTFVSLGNKFGYDNKQVFFKNKSLDGVDRATWRHWSGMLSVDKSNVFFTEKKVEGVDRASIILLQHEDCFMDRHRVYSGARAIPVEEYLSLLKYVEESCAWERNGLTSGTLFQRLLSEWPHVV